MTFHCQFNRLIFNESAQTTVLFHFNPLNINMSKSTLELLFDSRARVKLLKFLFRNADLTFGLKDIGCRIQERPSVVRREVKKLLGIGLLKQKNK